MTKFGNTELENLGERIPGLINIARIAIVLSLLVFQIFGTYSGIFSEASFPKMEFYSWAAAYAVLILLSIFRPDWQWQSLALPNASAVVDISMMMILVYIAGGLDSGFGILVLPFVATSCLLSYGHYPLLHAGYAAMLFVINMLLDGSLKFNPFSWDNRSVIEGGLLITACYLVAVLTAFAAKYLEKATESANKHQLAYRRLSGLNRLVLNRVQEAVVVIDASQRVWLFNKQAKTYFPNLAVDQQELVFSELVARWQYQPDKAFETDIHIFQHAMHVRAVPLIQEQTELLMLYVRSLREVAAEAMSTKLTSLGQLTANLAHEIRNPMSAIRHASDLLQEDDEPDPAKTKLYGIIDSNIRRIDKMLEDVSLLNKRDNISREPMNLMKFWLNFKQEFTLNNPAAIGCLRMNMDGNNLTILADAMHVQQIMWNLCNNAWRHSRQDENAITVLIRPSGRMHVSIVVADNGKGITPEVRSHLFEPFYTTEKQGTGLGLYVARELAHANMGQLHYHAEMNGFELILPREANE
ncbi:ATP-binding protein [Neisseria perflava]|uniref:ATP-binding protein n=1 Tax=Neisseria perflava TaxID=33053 RepID=UPI00209E94BE|nr:HAMP domain-containing sensor histidine kinase [Neisseria perflava]MCP1660322.1 two-component system sensor histidine kinase PilS (NtrC family) [Neisseria perflava]MCP1771515.1 two-component system sensor histidine kinase PilS (NtrC family) [Neisseria perflava]